ncbi:MAG: ATP-binding protein [Myxococcales bacterium]|nr:ATP-binding protein [Myxococcales bacterium]
MIERTQHLAELKGLLERHPVVGIVGARQVGKTTLARQLAAELGGTATFYDLEDPADRTRLAEPVPALRDAEGLVVLDEVQRLPELFTALRVLVDRPGCAARFLVLGSAAPALLRQSAESLAGRIAYHPLEGFHLAEVGASELPALWLRGGFPRAFLAASDAGAAEWCRQFVGTFLERDVPQLGLRLPATTLRRFWVMLAHVHGQTLHASELGRSLGVSDATVRRYLDALTSALVVRTLAPWFENLSKRQVKAPKVYVADPGLLHALLGVADQNALLGHPKVGASFEGFAIAEVVARLGARPEECFVWATHAGAELDLLVVRGRTRLGFEVKHTEAPRTTRSMHVALADLGLERLDVIHAGEHTFPLGERMRAVALGRVLTDVEPL